jgi:hypothetical protein
MRAIQRRVDHAACGDQSGFDGGTDPLARMLVCQPCRITNQENIRVLGDCRELCTQAISMTMKATREIRRDFVLFHQ